MLHWDSASGNSGAGESSKGAISVIHSITPAYHQWSTVSYPWWRWARWSLSDPDFVPKARISACFSYNLLSSSSHPAWSHPVSLLGHRIRICEEYGKKLLNGQWQASPAASVCVWASAFPQKVWAVNLYTDSILRHLLVLDLFFFFFHSLPGFLT